MCISYASRISYMRIRIHYIYMYACYIYIHSSIMYIHIRICIYHAYRKEAQLVSRMEVTEPSELRIMRQ